MLYFLRPLEPLASLADFPRRLQRADFIEQRVAALGRRHVQRKQVLDVRLSLSCSATGRFLIFRRYSFSCHSRSIARLSYMDQPTPMARHACPHALWTLVSNWRVSAKGADAGWSNAILERFIGFTEIIDLRLTGTHVCLEPDLNFVGSAPTTPRHNLALHVGLISDR
jgi:hypothetical protein